jgi:predicted enzyme related to lactoylglutathione lyase
MKKNPVVHFEMPYINPKRVSKFYEKAFGWDMQYLPDMGKYVMAYTSEMTKNNMHKKKGAINGGFYPKSKTYGGTHFVLSVENLEKQMKIVKEAGGKVKGKPQDIPGVGKFVMIKDTEGNEVGVLQPAEEQ